MLHLTPADYTPQPWANGRGTTTELWRLSRGGRLLVRLSRAVVVEEGPFSVFPGIERNLTVLSGPGFRLSGAGLDLSCDPLRPVAFPGDAELTATETGGRASEDFNVMTARSLPLPGVMLVQGCRLPADGLLALYALGPGAVNGHRVAPADLILTRNAVTLSGDTPMLAVSLTGIPPD